MKVRRIASFSISCALGTTANEALKATRKIDDKQSGKFWSVSPKIVHTDICGRSMVDNNLYKNYYTSLKNNSTTTDALHATRMRGDNQIESFLTGQC